MKNFLKKSMVAVALISAVTVTAQPREGQKPNPEIRKYLKQEVIPVLKTQRMKLDAVMSSADKATLEQIRTEMKALREDGAVKMQGLREDRTPGTPMSQEEKEQFRAHRDARIQLMDQAVDLADQYRNAIKRLMDEISSEREQWKNDLKNMREEMTPAEGRPQDFRKFGQEGMAGHHPFLRMMKPVGFMLWDPKTDSGLPEDNEGQVRARVFPNPGTGATMIGFQLQEEGKVTVVLLDNQGNQLETILDEVKSEGQHRLQIPTESLTPAVYFVKITTPAGSKTLRFMKQ